MTLNKGSCSYTIRHVAVALGDPMKKEATVRLLPRSNHFIRKYSVPFFFFFFFRAMNLDNRWLMLPKRQWADVCKECKECALKSSLKGHDVTGSFCRKERNAIDHLFWRCEKVKQFWEQLQTAINDARANSLSVNLNDSIVLFRQGKSVETLIC